MLCLPIGGQTLAQSLSISQSPSACWNLCEYDQLITAVVPQTELFEGFRQMLNKVSLDLKSCAKMTSAGICFSSIFPMVAYSFP